MMDGTKTFDQLVADIARLLIEEKLDVERGANNIAGQIVGKILAAVEAQRARVAARWRHANN